MHFVVVLRDSMAFVLLLRGSLLVLGEVLIVKERNMVEPIGIVEDRRIRGFMLVAMRF